MKTYIALLRGINVSGQKKIKMADLKALFENLGFGRVVTYIQSGNVIFGSAATSNSKLARQIAKAVYDSHGFEVPILVKTVDEIQSIIANNPLDPSKHERMYFTLLHEAPSEELVSKLTSLSYEQEEFVIGPHCVHFYSPIGYGRAKFNNNFFEKKLKVSATTRNYKTMTKLIGLAHQK